MSFRQRPAGRLAGRCRVGRSESGFRAATSERRQVGTVNPRNLLLIIDAPHFSWTFWWVWSLGEGAPNTKNQTPDANVTPVTNPLRRPCPASGKLDLTGVGRSRSGRPSHREVVMTSAFRFG